MVRRGGCYRKDVYKRQLVSAPLMVKVYTFVSNLYPLGGVTSFTEYVPSSSGVDKVAWPAVSVVKVATTEPVSYTHLDVYKRQDVHHLAVDAVKHSREVAQNAADKHFFEPCREGIEQKIQDFLLSAPPERGGARVW